MKYLISVPDPSEEKLFYSCNDEDIKTARIGYLRMDFGTGSEFHSTWWDTNPEMNDGAFKNDFETVIKGLRDNLLYSRGLMSAMIETMISLDLGDRGRGVKIETDSNIFYLRCAPQAGDYDCYCYCYDRGLLEQAMGEDMCEEEKIGMEMN